MKYLTILLPFLLIGCASPYARIGAYHQDSYPFVSDTVFKSEVGMEWDHAECAWSHLSELDRGTPFNNKSEVLGLDMVGCSVKFGGR